MSIWPNEVGVKLGRFLKANWPSANEGQALATYSEEQGYGLIWDGSLGPEPTREQVAAWNPDPRPDVKRKFQSARAAANDLIFGLMADVAVAMVAFGGFSLSAADDAGSDFVEEFQLEINAVLLSGRNPAKLGKLLTAIQNPDRNSNFSWLNQSLPGGGTIMGLLEAGLTPQEEE